MEELDINQFWLGGCNYFAKCAAAAALPEHEQTDAGKVMVAKVRASQQQGQQQVEEARAAVAAFEATGNSSLTSKEQQEIVAKERAGGQRGRQQEQEARAAVAAFEATGDSSLASKQQQESLVFQRLNTCSKCHRIGHTVVSCQGKEDKDQYDLHLFLGVKLLSELPFSVKALQVF
ncbi:hypothetical protein DUNSADRAFT_13433 [Dunaliella salina]|uniref:Encoded protein n=1 Tax=Dunaliella salina TaxID=3046 RepID=A0ABQ7G9D1_DUNSA|nr:hypothetical protein DUNSADRAFT_13433 [Dunaliella salina]|eukprot:KAF5831224.1 hypothetical protein DUNSADRAFT_13433 [Dunaliella salina]